MSMYAKVFGNYLYKDRRYAFKFVVLDADTGATSIENIVTFDTVKDND